jgi:hypothetical protein
MGERSPWQLLTHPTMHACVRERSAEKRWRGCEPHRLGVFPLRFARPGRHAETPHRGVPRFPSPKGREALASRRSTAASYSRRAPSPSSEGIGPDRSVRRGIPWPPERRGLQALPAGAAPGSISRADVFRKTPSPSRDDACLASSFDKTEEQSSDPLELSPAFVPGFRENRRKSPGAVRPPPDYPDRARRRDVIPSSPPSGASAPCAALR